MWPNVSFYNNQNQVIFYYCGLIESFNTYQWKSVHIPKIVPNPDLILTFLYELFLDNHVLNFAF